VYRFDPPNNASFGQDRHLRDPYEAVTVWVDKSRVHGSGDGLFARRNLRAGVYGGNGFFCNTSDM
jgi:hypothetical protein